MLTNHQLRDLTRGLRQSEPSKSLPNVILSAEIHALICGYFASLSMTRLTAHRFLKASQKAEPTARRKGNAKKSLACPRLPRRFLKTARNDGRVARQRHAKPPPLRRGLGVGCQRHATPRACRFSQKQSFKTLAARVIHERNLNAKRFFARAKLPFSFYALFLWQAAAFSSKKRRTAKAGFCHFERSEKSTL